MSDELSDFVDRAEGTIGAPLSGAATSRPDEAPDNGHTVDSDSAGAEGPVRKKRRRGSRGGRNRNRTRASRPGEPGPDDLDEADEFDEGEAIESDLVEGVLVEGTRSREEATEPELPERPIEGRIQDPAVASRALVHRAPRIGDSRPAPDRQPDERPARADEPSTARRADRSGEAERRPAAREGGRRRGGQARAESGPVRQATRDVPVELDEETLAARRGKERKGRPIGRYMMCVHVTERATHIAVLEGRMLIEHYVAKPDNDPSQIHGNVYLGKVQNVLPGMEAAFVDIGTPKNAVLYRGDLQYDREDVEEQDARIEHILKAKQTILCQVTKNPIAAKGARLTQEVSLPGRFVVLIPNSRTYGISKRLSDEERRRLRSILDRVKPPQHGVIVRTAAEGVTTEEIERDVARLLKQWGDIEALAQRSQAPKLLYREPGMAVRVIREEFNREYRGVVIDDPQLFEEVRDYVASISPALADRVEYFDPVAEPLPLFERFHVHEQLHKALDRKVWLPSGGSLIIEHTEALTVIDVNTGKNVGSSSLEETVFRNNLEAAEEIARQLRLRDIGGIIVIDFIDMEVRDNRAAVVQAFRDALSRDKTRTQVFEISDLGLVEMTRKRIGEGLLQSFTQPCELCVGRGVVVDHSLYE